MGDFKALKVWQLGMEIAERCLRLTTSFPREVSYNLGEQIKRSAISIPSNIAEGNARNSSKEYFQFASIALGSCFELETQLLLAQRTNIGDFKVVAEILELINVERKMLIRFRMKIHTNFST